MAVESPMRNFNRKNPYVIQAKQKYNELMVKYETASKAIITNSIFFLLMVVCSLIMHIVITDIPSIIFTGIIFISYVILMYFFIKNTIKDDINTDIDNMVTLESNEVMNIDVTYVQDLLYKINVCFGKIDAYIIWYRIVSSILSIYLLWNIIF